MATKTRPTIPPAKPSLRLQRYRSDLRIGFVRESTAEEEFEYRDIVGWSVVAYGLPLEC